ncbi:uncharacterized protein [Ptychodera flava]|uniref:uncharacterized protein isoform X2 n=1 Tax=Ptychodera flava TaxID=63121 RepID=UPI00396AA618
MDNSSSDRSPPLSESATGSWLRYWENESGSFSGANISISSNDIEGLVEDKDVAAKAVAFVINSTRKGVVPLCADVANLLRTKKKLEGIIIEQKQELQRLRNFPRQASLGSSRTSTSTSPTPPSITSYQGPAPTNQNKDFNRPCSRCSQCSSSLSSPKLPRSNSTPQESPQTSPTRKLRGSSKSFARPSSSNESLQSDHLPKTTPQPTINGVAHTNHSLPVEVVNEKANSVKRMRPVAKSDKEMQCSMVDIEQLERKWQEANNAKVQLEEELKLVRPEIERLRNKVQSMEELLEDRTRVCEVKIENEVEGHRGHDEQGNHGIHGNHENSECESVNLPYINSMNMKKKPPLVPRSQSVCSTSTSLAVPGPLLGCKCSMCYSLENNNGLKRVPLQVLMERNAVMNHRRQPIEVDDHVVVRGERTGYVRYIGHLDNVGSTHVVYVGLQLEAAVGRHDGFFNGKRYFWCHRNHGVFLPMQDVICVINKKFSQQIGSQRPKTSVVRRSAEDSTSGHKTMQSCSSSNSYSTNSNAHRKRTKSASGKKLITADTNSLKTKRESYSSQGSL